MIFPFETKINCFCLDRRSWYWTSPSTSLNSRTMKLIKHGRGSMMVSRCLTTIEFGVRFWSQNLALNSTRIIFQHDNDPKHTTKTMKEWLLNQPFSFIK